MEQELVTISEYPSYPTFKVESVLLNLYFSV